MKRYDLYESEMIDDSEGKYVLHDDAQSEIDRLRAENDRLSVGNRRYEIARRLDPRQWAAAFELNIKTGKAFDQIIDEIGAFVSPND